MTRRGKNFTDAERREIRALLHKGLSVRKIAAQLNRGKSGIQGQIDAMRASGEIGQTVMDFGQERAPDGQ